jgi:hypothetical protein
MSTIKALNGKTISLAIALAFLTLAAAGCPCGQKTARAPKAEHHVMAHTQHTYHDSSGLQFPGEPRRW